MLQASLWSSVQNEPLTIPPLTPWLPKCRRYSRSFLSTSLPVHLTGTLLLCYLIPPYALDVYYMTNELIIRWKVCTYTDPLLFLQALQQLLYLSVVCEANVGERSLRTLHKEAAQCPNRYSHASVGEQSTDGSIQASANTSMLVLSLTGVGREEVTWPGDQ